LQWFSWPRSDLHHEDLRLAAAQDFHADGFADHLSGKPGKERIVVRDGLAFDTDQDITDDQLSGFGGTLSLHADQQQSGGLFAF
jgi:hypothetical protein